MNHPQNEINKTSLPFALGVTGGIGSGKSLVCQMLEDLGARIVYADLEAKKLMVDNPEVRSEITAAFGQESYLEDGSLNRKHIASKIFGNEEMVAKINSIVHPRMAAVLFEAREKAAEDGIKLLVYEAALIYESGSADRLDAVAVVHTPVDIRIARVTARDSVSAEQVQNRMKHQLPPEDLLKKADFVVRNDSTKEELKERVQSLFKQVMQLAEDKSR